MKNYEEMKERISKYDAERKAQHQSVKDALEKARVDLVQLLEERDNAVVDGDIDQLVRKNAEVQIKELLVNQMQKQMEQFNLPVLSANDFQVLRKELFDFTNSQLGGKYRRVKDLLDSIEMVLNEIDQINDQHSDIYVMLEDLTYGLGEDTGVDANGVPYNRRISFQHRKPAVLEHQFQVNARGNIKHTIQNLVELNQYI